MYLSSHLLQMRGLKQMQGDVYERKVTVASFTDAWIETLEAVRKSVAFLSHLLQMRGLKLSQLIRNQCHNSRIFYRCVD